MEWVDHKFTPEHLPKLKEVLDNTEEGDIGHPVEDNVEWDNGPLLQKGTQADDENPVLELDDDLSNL